jgi:hypothetical protein
MELDELVDNIANIALAGLRSPEMFRPEPCKGPPLPLQRVIDECRTARHMGRVQAAREAYQAAIANPEMLSVLCAYREYLTYRERENARLLAAAAWTYLSLTPHADEGDAPLLAKLKAFRDQLFRDFGVSELRTERGWAEKQTYQGNLLPPIWRDT